MCHIFSISLGLSGHCLLITQTLILPTMPNVTESNEVQRFQSRLLSLFNVNKGGIAYEGRWKRAKILAKINPTTTESTRLCLRKAHDNVHESLVCDWLTTGRATCDWLNDNIEITQPWNARFARNEKQRRDQNKVMITKGNLTKSNRKSSEKNCDNLTTLKKRKKDLGLQAYNCFFGLHETRKVMTKNY